MKNAVLTPKQEAAGPYLEMSRASNQDSMLITLFMHHGRLHNSLHSPKNTSTVAGKKRRSAIIGRKQLLGCTYAAKPDRWLNVLGTLHSGATQKVLLRVRQRATESRSRAPTSTAPAHLLIARMQSLVLQHASFVVLRRALAAAGCAVSRTAGCATGCAAELVGRSSPRTAAASSGTRALSSGNCE